MLENKLTTGSELVKEDNLTRNNLFWNLVPKPDGSQSVYVGSLLVMYVI